MDTDRDNKITQLNCVVCDRPVDLRSAMVDERSRPIHEDCKGQPVALHSAETQRLRKAG